MDINFDLYKEPEWMRWENAMEYDAPVPSECIKDQAWKIRKVCTFCGEPTRNNETYCELHAKHFRKPMVKVR